MVDDLHQPVLPAQHQAARDAVDLHGTGHQSVQSLHSGPTLQPGGSAVQSPQSPLAHFTWSECSCLVRSRADLPPARAPQLPQVPGLPGQDSEARPGHRLQDDGAGAGRRVPH